MNDLRLAREMMISGIITTIVVLMMWLFVGSIGEAIDKEMKFDDAVVASYR